MDVKRRILSYLNKNQAGFIALCLWCFFLLYVYEWNVFYPVFSLRKVGILIWLGAIFFLRLEARVSIIVSFIFLGLLAAILLFFRAPALEEDLSVFIYFFLLIGISQLFYEYLKSGRRLM